MGDRPPTNPAIRVRFPSVVDEFFFRVRGRHLYATPINSNYSLQRKNEQRHLLDFLGSGLYTLSLYEKERTYKLVLWGEALRGGLQTILLYYATLHNYSSNLRRYPTRYKAYG